MYLMFENMKQLVFQYKIDFLSFLKSALILKTLVSMTQFFFSNSNHTHFYLHHFTFAFCICKSISRSSTIPFTSLHICTFFTALLNLVLLFFIFFHQDSATQTNVRYASISHFYIQYIYIQYFFFLTFMCMTQLPSTENCSCSLAIIQLKI